MKPPRERRRPLDAAVNPNAETASQQGPVSDEEAERRGTLPLLARQTLHIVEGTEDALARAREQQALPPRVEARPPLLMPLAGTPVVVAGEQP